MRSNKVLRTLLGAAVALGPTAGCGGGDVDGPANLADLQPPPAAKAGRGKAALQPSPRPPKFGSPPKSKAPQP